MRFVKPLFGFVLAISLAACASAPSSNHTSRKAYPEAHHHRGSASLSVCPGMNVSNAPHTDRSGRIANYQPITNVSGASLMRAPVMACVSSGFGPRKSRAGKFHKGVDLFTRTSTQVLAGGDGVVESVQTLRGYGQTVLIRHNGNVQTRYAHLSSYTSGLRKGARVRKGQIIGYTGRTGNATAVHLHYEILVNNRPRNPLGVGL